MKFKTLANREIRLEIVPEHFPVRSREQSKSVGQYSLGRSIKAIYGSNTIILEEFPTPGERLFLDFYLPTHGIAFEYHGEQHDKFNKHFHRDKSGFEKSKARDSKKRDWCLLNNIIMIEVRGNPSIEELKDVIQKTRQTNLS